jgi:probable F420-dependent oxidoreductase
MRIETAIPMDDWRAVGPAARAAEEAGFDGVLGFEIAHDPFVPLAFAAVATSRIGLGTAIAVAFPRSPMVVAHTAWDLQEQSGGRFSLGLGSQVKGHNERRFSVPWSPPVPRLREYVEALRAIWRCWEKREPLAFEGEHYRFSLMTPEFAPRPSGQPRVPVSVAAVRPAMITMAGRVCDGVKLHGFATRKYLEEVALPALRHGMKKSGRRRESFEISGGGFIATGADEAELAAAVEMIRYRIAFYGSTRTYHSVFEVHGWEDLGLKLHAMSKRGQWKEMAAEISDDVLREFTAVGTYDNLKSTVAQRFAGLSDTLLMAFGPNVPVGRQREILQELKSIPSPFERFDTGWD